MSWIVVQSKREELTSGAFVSLMFHHQAGLGLANLSDKPLISDKYLGNQVLRMELEIRVRLELLRSNVKFACA